MRIIRTVIRIIKHSIWFSRFCGYYEGSAKKNDFSIYALSHSCFCWSNNCIWVCGKLQNIIYSYFPIWIIFSVSIAHRSIRIYLHILPTFYSIKFPPCSHTLHTNSLDRIENVHCKQFLFAYFKPIEPDYDWKKGSQ